MKKDLNLTQSSPETVVLEGMTSISALLNSDCGNDRIIKEIWIDESKKESKYAEIKYLLNISQEAGYKVTFVTAQRISEISTGQSHGGILAFCSDRTIPSLTADDISENAFYAYIDGIEDPYNFGYTLRSLYAAGITGVILPERNWMSAAGTVARSSAGASERLPIFSCSADAICDLFHKKNYQILSAGIRDSVSIFEKTFSFPILLVIGGEKRGISRKILEKSDEIVRIDYGREFRGSLPAASAASILAFELFRQNRNQDHFTVEKRS